jgi:hypothetical protein|tara:strand:+ start:471 stop:614 length:144 start_codon:yes stop_codon:yes gene_type:complete
MDPSQIYFLLFVVLGVVVQSITGFAMGLIMDGVASTVFELQLPTMLC